ncbi:MAG: alanine--tRNA ligase [Oscillospiraceae bacterium]
MEWRGLNELREEYLSFFESKNHTRMASSSLVPKDDNSLLLINSGMAPLKKFFLGQAVPPNKRVTTCQKCIRTPDIENVGHTARHGTYFEMLGNFSFGDYFKNEAIEWAWEFFTEVLKMPKDKLHVSVYQDDDEAYDIWTQKIGVAPDHMVRLGKEDNFWEHGSGPCGPCSEIYFDRGAEKGCGKPDCHVGCDCDRYVEVWNLVFSQFDSDGNGHYAEMKNKNIDTGMGLERLACVMQGVDNLFEVDTVQNIMKHISNIAKVNYKENEKTDISLRVITDHIRSTTFMVGDGILPSNVGRGYVLRRLLRRACRHGRLIGINEPFLYKVCDTVIDENKCAYPELDEKREYIKKIIKNEEEQFSKTVDKGMELLSSMVENIGGDKVLSGDDAFKLSDTYGFPIDLTLEIVEEKGITIDMDRYQECVKAQRELAKKDHIAKAKSSWESNTIKIDAPKTIFTGYTDMKSTDSKVLAIYKDGESVQSANEGEDVTIILDKTPFYAESGGQVGDTGIINGSAIFEVTDTTKNEDGHYLHFGIVSRGIISINDVVSAEIDQERRKSIMRNHTTAHILQASLREVLGDHVHQAGQLVNENYCRFDFSHFSAMTTEEIQKVESLVNEKILSSIPVSMTEMPIDEAKKLGAMALFGEKYGDIVRVVTIGEYSKEFCGGTHIDNTSKIGLFKIVSESSVASGVRRIEAVTGKGVLQYISNMNDLVKKSIHALKIANVNELANKCTQIVGENKELEKTINNLNQQIADLKSSSVFTNLKEVDGIYIARGVFKNTKPDILLQMGDKAKNKYPNSVGVFVNELDDKGNILVVCGKDAITKGMNAGKIVKTLAEMTGGKGGGRPDTARAGIGDLSKIEQAMGELENIVKSMVK